MNRPFTPDDGGKKFQHGTRPGKLEYPLTDPGSAKEGEAIIWYDTPYRLSHIGAGHYGEAPVMIHWDYVAPSEVEPLR